MVKRMLERRAEKEAGGRFDLGLETEACLSQNRGNLLRVTARRKVVFENQVCKTSMSQLASRAYVYRGTWGLPSPEMCWRI